LQEALTTGIRQADASGNKEISNQLQEELANLLSQPDYIYADEGNKILKELKLRGSNSFLFTGGGINPITEKADDVVGRYIEDWFEGAEGGSLLGGSI